MNPERFSTWLILPFTQKWTNPKLKLLGLVGSPEILNPNFESVNFWIRRVLSCKRFFSRIRIIFRPRFFEFAVERKWRIIWFSRTRDVGTLMAIPWRLTSSILYRKWQRWYGRSKTWTVLDKDQNECLAGHDKMDNSTVVSEWKKLQTVSTCFLPSFRSHFVSRCPGNKLLVNHSIMNVPGNIVVRISFQCKPLLIRIL